MISILFIPSHNGLDRKAGILGNLIEVDPTKAVGTLITGESLAAIRVEHNITRSAAGIAADVAAKQTALTNFTTARSQMIALLDALPSDTRGPLLIFIGAVNNALDRATNDMQRGDLAHASIELADAHHAVLSVEKPVGSSLSDEDFASRKTAMLALMPL